MTTLISLSQLSAETRTAMAENAALMLNGVKILAERGDPEALTLFESALEIGVDPQEGIRIAKLAAGAGHAEISSTLLARMIEIEPGNVDLLIAFASALLDTRQAVEAAQIATGAATRYVGELGGEWMSEAQQARLAEIYCILGEALRLAAHEDDAVTVLGEAADLDPGNGRIAALLAEILVGLDRDLEAIEVCRRAHANGALSAELAYSLGKALFKLGRKEEARDAFEDALLLAPRNERLALMVSAAAEGGDVALPLWRVEKLFDQLASHYDERVLQGASYRVPGLVLRAVERHFPGRRWERAVDLGCGTGLVGLLLQEHCAFLRGIDVSAGMIRVARERGIYGDLVKGDFRDALKGEGEACDLIVAADSLVYQGDLQETFDLVAKALDKNGIFVFSLDRLDGGGAWSLEASGRFAHTRAYVEGVLAKAGLTVRECIEDHLLVDANGALLGILYVAYRA